MHYKNLWPLLVPAQSDDIKEVIRAGIVQAELFKIAPGLRTLVVDDPFVEELQVKVQKLTIHILRFIIYEP